MDGAGAPSEAAARERMRAHAAAGDPAAALGVYAELEARLARESTAPSRETRRLLAELRSRVPPPLGTAMGERRLGEDPR